MKLCTSSAAVYESTFSHVQLTLDGRTYRCNQAVAIRRHDERRTPELERYCRLRSSRSRVGASAVVAAREIGASYCMLVTTVKLMCH